MQVRLIVTADDLGIAPERDQGIFAAYTKGIVTNASLIVNGCSAREAGMILHSLTFPFKMPMLVVANRERSESCAWPCMVFGERQKLYLRLPPSAKFVFCPLSCFISR